MSETYDADVAVIGGGIIGTTAALTLQDRGYRVLVLDPDGLGAGAASGSAGYLHDGEIFPMAEPGLPWRLPGLLMDGNGPLALRASYLPRIFGWGIRFLAASRTANFKKAVAALASLNRLAIASLAELARSADAGALLVRTGGLKVCRDVSTLRAVDDELHALRDAGIVAETIDLATLRKLEPAVTHDVAGAVFFPNSAHCSDPKSFGERLATRVLQRGRLERARATRLCPQRDGSWLVRAGRDMQISAGRVLVAAGAWSASLLRPLGYRVSLAAARGYHLMLAQPGIALEHPIIFFEPHFAATPMSGGIRLAGTVEFAAPNAPLDRRRVDMLYDLAIRYLPGLQRSPATSWMGVRPATPDSLPVLGAAHRHPNLYCSFGHGHLGLTQAAISARCVADIMGAQKAPVDLAPFALARFER